MTSRLRIFSYLPNPRLWKATIAARLADVPIEVRGDAPREMQHWLWDFDAHKLDANAETDPTNVRAGTGGFAGKQLQKTEAFLDAAPFGAIPVAFSPDGKIGVFESNSILRAVARLADGRALLYGCDVYQASRIDAFLDAGLICGRDTQPYLVSLLGSTIPAAEHQRARDAVATYLGGIERALAPARQFLVGDALTIADICFVCEITMLYYEKPRLAALRAAGLAPVLPENYDAAFPRAADLFARLRTHPAFAVDLETHLKKLEGGIEVLNV
ncbi:MAG: glutathione S-transferase [Gammaproteobacteria bacterium]|nr:glutathione S-transferase [Gammaproteobacteria bacterium]